VLVDRNPACTFADITPSPPKKIQLYDFIQGSVAEAPGAYASLYGTDESNNWIWTEVGGQMIEGERVPLVENTFTTSTRYFNSLARVIKPPTVGDVVAYEYDPAAGARTKQLARWEPDETNPVYRRSFVPGVAVTGSDCSLIPLTALVKLRHLPVALPTDFLVLGCLEAIVLMVQGILKRERNLLQESMMYEAAATKALQEELRSHLGSGPALQVRFAPAEIWGGGGIRNAI